MYYMTGEKRNELCLLEHLSNFQNKQKWHMSVCVCVYARTYTYRYTHTRIYVYIYTYTHMNPLSVRTHGEVSLVTFIFIKAI